MLFPERPFKSSPKLKSSFDSDNGLDYPDDAPTKSKNMPIVQSSLPTLGIRNLVKDSIYKDNRELSARICTEEVKDHSSNCGDQPRQLNGPPCDSTHGKSKGLVDINESLRVLAKLREASWTPPESAHHARLSYDAPRFSYDGKEAASKLREVPRLSLDIKEGHLWNREIDSRSNPSLSSAATLLLGPMQLSRPSRNSLPASGFLVLLQSSWVWKSCLSIIKVQHHHMHAKPFKRASKRTC
jgi:hypothetical protein